MFEAIRKKIDEQNKDNNPKNMSLDFKLMFVYHISMMVLFGTRVLDNAADQAWFALILFIVLVLISVAHRFREKWKWPGIGILGIPLSLLGVGFVYAFLAFAAYSMNPDLVFPNFKDIRYIDLIADSWSAIITAASVPVFTPWFLAGVGIGVFNLLSSLKLVRVNLVNFFALYIK
jgi:hypothetical protein